MQRRGLAPATLQKLRGIFQVQLVRFAEESGVTFLREFNSRNLTEWRQTWKREKELARKKKFERVIGFFWYCVRQGWLRENPTATMGRVIAKHVPTDYFTADEYKRGTFSDDASLVLTETQYFDRLAFESPLDIKLRADMLGKSLLFLGYSFSDINLRLMLYKLMKLRKEHKRTDRLPTAIMAGSGFTPIQRELLERWDVLVIELDPVDRDKSLDDFLGKLG